MGGVPESNRIGHWVSVWLADRVGRRANFILALPLPETTGRALTAEAA